MSDDYEDDATAGSGDMHFILLRYPCRDIYKQPPTRGLVWPVRISWNI